MNLLVTGAAGFIGSHYVLRHVEQFPQDKIVVLDKLTYAADKSFLDPVMGAVFFMEGDIADKKLVTSIVEGHNIDVIINFAAESHVDNSISDATPFLHTNVVGTQNLVEVCRDHKDILLLHVSTDEVFGDIDDSAQPHTVDDQLKPSSPYAASKAAAEMMVLAGIRTHGIRARITRCTNNYGPHQHSEKLIPTIVRKALQDEKVPIYAQGKNKRDWLYVTDHTDAIEIILQKGKDGEIYHISADDERQNIDVAKKVLALLDKKEDLIEFVKDRPGHDWRYALDSSNTRALGWKPKVSFEEGLKNTVEWYKSRG